MESTPEINIDRAVAARDLRSVEDARRDMVSDVVCPPGYELTVAASAGLNVAGVGMLMNESVPLQVNGLMLVLAGVAGVGWSVRRFRGLNGVWVSGYRRGSARSTTLSIVAIQMLAITVAIVSSNVAGWWWVGIVLAPFLMLLFVAGNRRWIRLYRAENGLDA